MVLILFIILLSLLFILWARIMIHELSSSSYTQNLTTTAKRVRCLAQYGWEVDPGGETKRQAVIPNPLDTVYREYNKLQLVCGFDLNDHCGKTVTVIRVRMGKNKAIQLFHAHIQQFSGNMRTGNGGSRIQQRIRSVRKFHIGTVAVKILVSIVCAYKRHIIDK